MSRLSQSIRKKDGCGVFDPFFSPLFFFFQKYIFFSFLKSCTENSLQRISLIVFSYFHSVSKSDYSVFYILILFLGLDTVLLIQPSFFNSSNIFTLPSPFCFLSLIGIISKEACNFSRVRLKKITGWIIDKNFHGRRKGKEGEKREGKEKGGAAGGKRRWKNIFLIAYKFSFFCFAFSFFGCHYEKVFKNKRNLMYLWNIPYPRTLTFYIWKSNGGERKKAKANRSVFLIFTWKIREKRGVKSSIVATSTFSTHFCHSFVE